MTKVLSRFGDTMLGALLGKEEAGACVPENGTSCGCAASNGYCSSGVYFRYWRQATYNCTGSCVTSTSKAVCYVKKAGLC
jgi:hypothetical protein